MQGLCKRVADWCGFTRTDTSVIKGIAILVMLAHHLYGMYGIDVPEALTYSDTVRNGAGYGKNCVLLFLFVTGYGYCCAAMKERRGVVPAVMRRLRGFYPLFLGLLAGMLGLSLVCPQVCKVPVESWADAGAVFICGVTGLADVVTDYWYAAVFLVAAVVFYPLLLLGKRWGRRAELAVFAVLCVLCGLGEHGYGLWQDGCNQVCGDWAEPWFHAAQSAGLGESFRWVYVFFLGWACAAVKLEPGRKSMAMLVLAWAVVCYVRPSRVIFLLVFVWGARLLGRWRVAGAMLGKLGALSAVMWLTHRLIFGYWFADFFYTVPAPLNYLLLVVLSALAAQVFLWGYNGVAHILASLGARLRVSGARRP